MIEEGDKLDLPRESIKEEDPDSPLPVIDENIPSAPPGKKRFLDIVIANKMRKNSSNPNASESDLNIHPSQASFTNSAR